MTPQDFYRTLEEDGFSLASKQKEQFDTYFKLLVEWNTKINLTAITEKNEVYLKHFYDSIAPILQGFLANEPIKLLDIGAGAGFPSLPMKILFPNLEVTIIDSLNKRISFLTLLAQELGLENVHFFMVEQKISDRTRPFEVNLMSLLPERLLGCRFYLN